MKDYRKLHPELAALIEKGWSIKAALERLDLNRRQFYSCYPKQLLRELQHLRATHSLKPQTTHATTEFPDLCKLSKAALLNPFGDLIFLEEESD